jgi:hypothetical protein
VERRYEEPRAHALRERYLATFGGPEIPVPVEAIAEDLLGLRVEESTDLGECSGMLLPVERRIIVNASERMSGDVPIRRHRFTIAHEVGHWICHAVGSPAPQPSYCRARDLGEDADRALEREANIFGAELLMPEPAVRRAWGESDDVAACAARFEVLPSAMQWRLFSFGLAAERPA